MMTEHQDWQEPVEWRIGRLEASQRRLRGWVIGLSVMLLVVFFYAARPVPGLPDVISARQFRVVDEDGNWRGIFSASEYGARLGVWGGEGDGRLEMTIERDGRPVLTLWGAGGDSNARLQQEEDGAVSLRMWGEGEEEAGYLTLLVAEEESLVRVGSMGEGQWAQMFQGAEGSRFYLSNAGETETSVYLGIPPDGYPVLQFAEDERRTMQLSRWDPGVTGLMMFGPEDEVRVGLRTVDDGSSSLRLAWDWEEGRPLAAISMDISKAWGGPFFTLADNRLDKVVAMHAGGEEGSFIGIHEGGPDWTLMLPEEPLEPEETPAEETDTPAAAPSEE